MYWLSVFDPEYSATKKNVNGWASRGAEPDKESEAKVIFLLVPL